MRDKTTALRRLPRDGADLLVFSPAENVDLDQDCLVELYVAHGEIGAQNTISDALDAIDAKIVNIRDRIDRDRHEKVLELALEIASIASSIGFRSCVVAASHLGVCVKNGDHVAIHATLSRLERISQMSCAEDWVLQDLSC